MSSPLHKSKSGTKLPARNSTAREERAKLSAWLEKRGDRQVQFRDQINNGFKKHRVKP